MAFDFVEIEDAEVVAALQEAGLSTDLAHREEAAKQLLESSMATPFHNVKSKEPLGRSERHAAMAAKFGGARLRELELPDDPVIDVPPTGSRAFNEFVAEEALRVGSIQRASIENFTTVIRDAERLLRYKPQKHESFFAKVAAVFSADLHVVHRVYTRRQKNYVVVVAKFGKRKSVSTRYELGGLSIQMSVHMNGTVTRQNVMINEGRSAQRLAAAFEPNVQTGVVALHALRAATRSGASDISSGNEFAY